MEFVAILLATYVTAVADTALAPALAVFQITPCFLPLIAIVATVAAPSSHWRVAQMAFVGLAFDFNTGGRAGIGLMSFALAAHFIMQSRGLVRRLEPLEQALVCAPLVAAVLSFAAIGNAAFGLAGDALGRMFVRIGGSAIYTALLSLPMWMVFDWLRASRRSQSAAQSR
jgi:rod shape-determining protein MreD